MKKLITLAVLILCGGIAAFAFERQNLWPSNRIPDYQEHQYVAFRYVAREPDFRREKHREPYLEWFEKPSKPNGCCMILISGGAYNNLSDAKPVENWHKELTALGFQCVSLMYRIPRPEGLAFYQTAWEDGQRAVRLVRSQAAKRGYDPQKIGTISMSAGSHLAMLLATSSETASYRPLDKIDTISPHINWAIAFAPAYLTTDGYGTAATLDGYGTGVTLSDIFKFDSHTPPVSLHHGGADKYSPNGSTLIYREFLKRNIPAELHLYAGKGHGIFGFERGVEFMERIGVFEATEAGSAAVTEAVAVSGECAAGEPRLEWFVPSKRSSDAIQIVICEDGDGRDVVEAEEARRFLNAKGVAVVVLKNRSVSSSDPSGYVCGWQDLQRAVRVVRSEAAGRGLSPDKIGIMGCAAGGYLTLLGVTSSLHSSYRPVDEIDKLPCNVQWGIVVSPSGGHHSASSSADFATLPADLSFDVKTAPTLFIDGDFRLLHSGDSTHSPLNSVLCWEKMRSIGVQCDLHTFAGDGKWLERVWEYIEEKIREYNSQK